jgi:hypothetical protein
VAFRAGGESFSVKPERHAFVVWCVGLERDYAQLICRSIYRHVNDADGERAAHARLLRCVFGSLPCHPVALDSSWLTWQVGTIPKLADSLYQDRARSSGHLDKHRLAVLAAALEDAGCDNAEILAHCRGQGPHVRGCWVVDLLLGKE